MWIAFFKEKEMSLTYKTNPTSNIMVSQPKRMGRPRREYWAMPLVMEYIKDEKFQTLGQYRDWVKEQKNNEIFPLHPEIYYKDYPGVDTFLGNPVGFSKMRTNTLLTCQESRIKSANVRRANAKKRKAEAIKKIASMNLVPTTVASTTVASTPKTETVAGKPNVATCIKVLLEHNVSFSTLCMVNKEVTNLNTEDAREITNVLFEFLSKKKVTA
jgi:hypothetical protein